MLIALNGGEALTWESFFYLLAYLFLFLSLSGMVLWLVLQLRVVAIVLGFALRVSAAIMWTIDRCIILPLALLGMGGIVLLEKILREGVSQRCLGLYTARIFLVLVGLYALVHVVDFLLHL